MPPAADVLGQVGPHDYEFFQHSADVPFAPERGEYNPAHAFYLSDCALLAYSNHNSESEVENEIRPPLARMFGAPPHVKVFIGLAYCWKQPIPDDRIQCFVAHNNSWGVVAFRGTLPESIPNWLTDADCVLEEDRGPGSIRVHQGFRNALDCLWMRSDNSGLGDYLSSEFAKYPNLKLWFTGHSLGAALATLAIERFDHAQALYTFGSPKVGNQAFADHMMQLPTRHFRVVNESDIVTNLPLMHQFEHCGNLKHLEQLAGLRSKFLGLLEWLRLPSDETSKSGEGLLKCFDDLSHLDPSHLAHKEIVHACLDHSPVLYSKNLWNELVRNSK
jgi:hypothetical protein